MKISEKFIYIIKPIQNRFSTKTPRSKILDELTDVQEQLDYYRNQFNSIDDKDLIESCIYQMESLEVRYNYLIKQARNIGLTYNELLDSKSVSTAG